MSDIVVSFEELEKVVVVHQDFCDRYDAVCDHCGARVNLYAVVVASYGKFVVQDLMATHRDLRVTHYSGEAKCKGSFSNDYHYTVEKES